MKTELMEQLEGYAEIVKEIEFGRKYGSGFVETRGQVSQFINRIHPKQVELRISAIIEETASTKTLRLVPVHGYLPPFRAGQYVSLCLEIDRIKTTRPYSISSSPTEHGYWDLTIRRVENGLVANYLLDRAAIGQTLVSTGPQGNFCFNPIVHAKEMVCLAGGSGITPFISMIREIVSRGLERTVYLLYGSRTLEDAIFHRELESMAAKYHALRYIPVIEHPPKNYSGFRGFIGSDVIREAVGSLQGKSVFICGPQAMYDYCLEQLTLLDYPQTKIRREMYGVPIKPWQSPGWPKEVAKDKKVSVYCNGEKVGDCKAGDALISVLEKNHTPLPTVCRSGECSMCRVKLVKGQVFQPKGTLLRKADRKFGFIHACASYPLTDIEIQL